MGYYVRITDSSLIIKNEVREKVLAIWKDLNHPRFNDKKNGGSWSGGKQTGWHYSWLDENYDKKVSSVEEMLEMLGFEFETNDNSDVLILGYDSKIGNESFFFESIARQISGGQYVAWSGEDGESFVWYFNGKEMKEMSMKDFMGKTLAERSRDLYESEQENKTVEKIEQSEMAVEENKEVVSNTENKDVSLDRKNIPNRFKNVI